MASSAAAAGIFGDGVAAGKKKEIEKRTMLKNIDSVATKVLDPYNVSMLDEIPLDVLWGIVKKGDPWCQFFSELAADAANSKDPVYRVGIGISRLSEVLSNAINNFLTNTELRKLMKDASVAKLDVEAKELLPYLKRLNAGKASFKAKETTFGGLKRQKVNAGDGTAGPAPTGDELKEAAGKMFEWLQKGPASNLRMFMVTISAGGVYFAAHALDKTGRAWVLHQEPAVTEDTVLKALTARHTASASSSVTLGREKATGDLFDD
jgi:hypothetical protein